MKANQCYYPTNGLLKTLKNKFFKKIPRDK